MENAHFILLAGKYPDVTTIHDYIDNRERHLKDVQEACGVPRWAAKQFFLILIFGGTIATTIPGGLKPIFQLKKGTRLIGTRLAEQKNTSRVPRAFWYSN
jgi:hypothetical protein